MARKHKTAEPTGVAPIAHLRGIGFSLALTALSLIATSILISTTGLTETAARWIMVAAGSVAVLFGSSQTAKSIGKSGWLNGGITGLAYAVVLLILAILLDMGLTAYSLITLAGGFILGALGGVLGVNKR